TDCQLLLVGDGPQRQHLGNRARDLGVADRVTFCGLVDRAAIASDYAASDLFVFTSLTETQGLVLDEALPMRVPLVPIAEGGGRDGLRQRPGAVVIEPARQGLKESYGAALGDALRHLEALREEAASSRHSPLQQARKLLTVYQAAMATCKR